MSESRNSSDQPRSDEADGGGLKQPTPLENSANQNKTEPAKDANTASSRPSEEVEATEQEQVSAPEGKVISPSFWKRLGSPTATAAIAIIAAAISLASATASVLQERVAQRQNTIALRQQLVSLVADISHAPSLIQTAAETYKGDETRRRDAIETIDLTKLLQAEEAASVIESLPTQEVASNEYFIVATALDESSRDKATPLKFLDRAASNASSPHIRANVLRQSAKILYELRGQENIAAAGRKIDEAKGVYAGVPFTTSDDKNADLAYTLLFDAQFQVKINCQKAREELVQAKKITDGGPSLTTTGSATLLERLPPLLEKC
jgi:hypothetical protein